MPLKSNKKIFEYSVAHPEVTSDPFYRNEKIVIPPTPFEENELVRANRDLIEQITAYKVARAQNGQEMQQSIIERIQEILSSPQMNVSEFVTFWATMDLTYSGYSILKNKEEFLRAAVEEYIDKRHDMYIAHGYSATTMQVRQDSFAHKGSGTKALYKLSSLFERHGFSKATTLDELLASDRAYIFPDGVDARVFDELLVNKGLQFDWSRLHQGKRPDAAFYIGSDLFLLEHKHKKEGGGGQNGQLSEIISFIQSTEHDESIHFVSFLDGIYFNELVNVASVKSKVFRQLEQIKQALETHERNYFLNTEGFNYLLS